MSRKEKVTFDPTVLQHRVDFADFIKLSSWKNSKVMYEVKGTMYNQIAAMQRLLLEYYIQK